MRNCFRGVLFVFASGFKPFVDACIDGGNNNEAMKYISKLSNLQEKADVSVSKAILLY